VLVLASVPFVGGAFEVQATTAGRIFPEDPEAGFSPVKSFEGGKITVVGFVPRSFLRGDSNHDSKVDLSDAVATLLYLFSGGGTPPCLDAADVDDSNRIEITDAVFLLGALFLGTKTIPEPYPECGTDSTQDSLGCKEACP
jgi:hypothetical protein